MFETVNLNQSDSYYLPLSLHHNLNGLAANQSSLCVAMVDINKLIFISQDEAY